MSEEPPSSPDHSETTSSEEHADPPLNRRSFVLKGAALAAGATLTGASGLSAEDATDAEEEADEAGSSPSQQECRSMEVSFDFQAFDEPDPEAILESVRGGSELVQEAIRACDDDGGWGEWLNDAGGEQALRSVGFKHVPFQR